MTKKARQTTAAGLTRRDLLKTSGLALGGLAMGGTLVGAGVRQARAAPQCGSNGCGYPNSLPTQQYTYPARLAPFARTRPSIRTNCGSPSSGPGSRQPAGPSS